MMPDDLEGCWVGIKRCGCFVAVVKESAKHAGDVETTKHEFLSDGLSVVYATKDEWTEKYLPKFLEDCPHASVGVLRREETEA